MSGADSSSVVTSASTSIVLDMNDPYYIHPNDSSVSNLIGFKLVGTTNFRIWYAAMERAFKNKNKLVFVNGKLPKPTGDSVKVEQWERVESIVLTWILGAVSEDLYQSIAFSKSAKDVWDELKETYEKRDGSVIYNIHQKMNSLNQSGLTVSEYYSKLNALWKEYDALTDLPLCSCDASKPFTTHVQQTRLMQFLMGLDDSFSQIRSHILLQDPLPSVKVAFATISREESHRGSSTVSQSKNNVTAFVSKTNQTKKVVNKTNQNLVCKHCGIKGHTIERCYKLIGYPKTFKPRDESANNFVKASANSSVSETTVASQADSSNNFGFTSEQIAKLLSLINEKNGSDDAIANMAGIGCFTSNMARTSFNCEQDQIRWVIDSGANQHMTISDKNLTKVVDVTDLGLTVDHPNGTFAKIHKIGNLKLSSDLSLLDVLVVPEFEVHLISVHKLIRDNGCSINFLENEVVFQDLQSKQIVGSGKQTNGLYHLSHASLNHIVSHQSRTKCFVSKVVWHNRMGHPSDVVLKVLKNQLNFGNDNISPCDVCHKAKQSRTPFPVSVHKSVELGGLVHLDVWGPYRVTSHDGFRSFLTIVDDYTRAVWVYFLKSKDEVYESFVSFYNLVKTQFDKAIKVVRTDNGTEFFNKRMNFFLAQNGIVHQSSTVYTPQQNGVVERKHRHLLNVARSLMFQGGVPLRFWSEAVSTATYLINRTPSSILDGKSPFELIYGSVPNLKHLRTFGCLCFTTRLNVTDKFAVKSDKCVLIGFSNVKKAYKVLSLDTNSVFFSRDVQFYEHVFPFKMKSDFSSKTIDNLESHSDFFDFEAGSSRNMSSSNDESQCSPDIGDNVLTHSSGGSPLDQQGSLNRSGVVETVTHDSGNITSEVQIPNTESVRDTVDTIVDSHLGSSEVFEDSSFDCHFQSENKGVTSVRKSSRDTRFPRKYDDYIVEGKYKYGVEKVVNYSKLSSINKCFVSNLNKITEPSSFVEANSDPNWVNAMNEEMEALLLNKTWVLCDLPKGRKPIGCRWVYKVKYKSTGEVERFKARLVAKGYNQKEGVDYEETFSPVAKLVTVRILLCIAVNNNWPLFQLDINNAFLYGTLDADVYMSLPPGYYTDNKTKVCKLVKSLYGLKQAPRKWNEKLTSCLLNFGFVQSLSDYSLYVKQKGNSFVALLVYVDDIILTGNDLKELNFVKEFVKSQFRIKDLGMLKYFLGIEILSVGNGICMSQRKYCLELLFEFGMLGCKPLTTPIDANTVVNLNGISAEDHLLTNVTVYQKLVGKLIYLTITRPDISFSVHTLSQFMHSPRISHFKLALRLLRYLKLNPGKGVFISKGDSLNLKAYVDADWGKCLSSRRSVTGYCIFLGNSLISWKSKKQDTVSKSSTESEYRALGVVTSEVLWIIKLLTDFGFKNVIPGEIFCDNDSAIKLALNPVFHERTKHLEIDLHFVRDRITRGLVKVLKINSLEQKADIFTKSLLAKRHNYLCSLLNLIDPFQSKD